MRSITIATLFALTVPFLGCDPQPGGDPIGEQPDPIDDEPGPVDPHQAFLLDWYADYDADYGMNYLDETGTPGTIDGENGETYDILLDAAYGPHTRTVMDLFFPKDATEATPVVMYVHGGGFLGGDKEKLIDQKWSVAEAYLEAGFAVASISYRLKPETEQDARNAPRPDGDCARGDGGGCRLDYIYRDGARAVQYLRHRSEELNLDPNRIGVWGGSAGGQIITWIGTAPDLAVADHEDPVLRQSTRVQAIGHVTSQLSANTPNVWRENLPFSDEFFDFIDGASDYNQAFMMSDEDLEFSDLGKDLSRVVNFLDAMTEDDPPFITANNGGDHSEEWLLNENNDNGRSQFTHHPRHSDPLFEKCQSLGMECEICVVYQCEGDSDFELHPDENVQNFFLSVLGE